MMGPDLLSVGLERDMPSIVEDVNLDIPEMHDNSSSNFKHGDTCPGPSREMFQRLSLSDEYAVRPSSQNKTRRLIGCFSFRESDTECT
jgi:hypothetical protein